MKIKENGKIDKYMDFVWELKKLRNIKLIPIEISALGMVSKGLKKNWEDRRSEKESGLFRL